MDDEIRRAQAERAAAKASLAGLGSLGAFDTDIYGGVPGVGGPGGSGDYVSEIPVGDEDEDAGGAGLDLGRGRGGTHPGSRAGLPERVIADMRRDAEAAGDDDADVMREYQRAGGSGLVNTRIADREDSYHARRRGRALSPERAPAGAAGSSGEGRSYADVIREAALAKERAELQRRLERQQRDGVAVPVSAVPLPLASSSSSSSGAAGASGIDLGAGSGSISSAASVAPPAPPSSAAGSGVARKRRRWDDAPAAAGADATSDAASVASGSGASTIALGGAASIVSGQSARTAGLSVAPAVTAPYPGLSAAERERASEAAADAHLRSSRWDDHDDDGAGVGAGAGAGRGSSAAVHGGFASFEDQAPSTTAARAAAAGAAAAGGATAGATGTGRRRSRWDETPAGVGAGATSAAGVLAGDATPAAPGAAWATPLVASGGFGSSSAGAGAGAGAGAAGAAQPRAKRSRWDETPQVVSGSAADGAAGAGAGISAAQMSALAAAATPMALSGAAATPLYSGGAAAATPTPGQLAGAATPLLGGSSGAGAGGALPGSMTPQEMARARAEAELDARNKPFTDDELDAMFPPGYRVLEPPAGYVPLRTPSRKLTATPTPSAGALGGAGAGAGGATGFRITDTPDRDAYGVPLLPEGGGDGAAAGGTPGGDLPAIRPEEVQYFGKLLERGVDEEALPLEEQKERAVMRLLLKIKNGNPPQRKAAMRQIADKARYFGAGLLFGQILPLMMSPALEDIERHLLVKLIDRVLFKLEDAVRPYTHKILAVIEPMLIDEDYYARIEGREIIANLAKAAGLATMISTMRPDIDHEDEYVRNTTSRAFAVVAGALGVPAMLPFLKAVAASRKSWQARHTGLKIVQQTAILLGVAVLPHLKLLVDIVAPGLTDDNFKVRIMAALAVAALAEAAHPYGIEAMAPVLRPLAEGVQKHRGKTLAAFLKAFGALIPLMEPEYASMCVSKLMPSVVREFATPDDEMKKIVLKVVKQCVMTVGVTPDYVRAEVLPPFFKHFWVRRMAIDRRNYRALVDTTVSLAERVGGADVIAQLVEDLKDDAEPYRRMVMDTIQRVVSALGVADVSARLEEQLMDGILYAFQESTTAAAAGEDEGGSSAAGGGGARVILNGFGTVVAALGARCKPYLPQIAGTIKWRLNNKSPQVRMEAADLVGKVAPVMRACGEDGLLGHMGVVLFECLGEEYPEVLGSILGGLRSIVAVIGMSAMQPPVKDLLPRLTPILRNRHEKVQESCIDVVGRIADRGAEFVPAKEWMRICFDLLEMLRAPRKSIRRACVNTFGYIAKAIGPQDVLHALLNNLKVQERTNRVCTTIAIAIVAEQCQPFTVLPALMNEYRTPDLQVQNGVLKALSFMFEYIGSQSRDYVYALVPLLEDALMERDPVHRQTAMFAVKHLALGLQGLGCEDALQHLLNFVWPNVFESLPHVILSFFESIEALRVSVGPHVIMSYVLQGLFHPARRVREPYWKVYNNLYIYAADALTPVFPPMVEDKPAAGGAGAGSSGSSSGSLNRYTRTYLQLLV